MLRSLSCCGCGRSTRAEFTDNEFEFNELGSPSYTAKSIHDELRPILAANMEKSVSIDFGVGRDLSAQRLATAATKCADITTATNKVLQNSTPLIRVDFVSNHTLVGCLVLYLVTRINED